MDSNKFFGGLVLIVLVLAIGSGVFFPTGIMRDATTEGEIDMIEPCSWVWCTQRNAWNAQQVNQPNSLSNLNNSQAEKYNAEATAIVADAMQAEAEAFKAAQEGVAVSAGNAVRGAVVGSLGTLCFAGLIVLGIALVFGRFNGA